MTEDWWNGHVYGGMTAGDRNGGDGGGGGGKTKAASGILTDGGCGTASRAVAEAVLVCWNDGAEGRWNGGAEGGGGADVLRPSVGGRLCVRRPRHWVTTIAISGRM